MPIWKRFKSGYTTGTSLTVTFDEGTPLDNTHTLFAVVYISGTSAEFSSNSWGASPLSGSNNNGSVTYLGAINLRGDGSTNSLTVNVGSSRPIGIQLYAFEGYASLTLDSGQGANTNANNATTPTATASASANTIAIAGWGLAGLSGGWGGTFANGFSSPMPTTDGRQMSAVLASTSAGATPFTATSWTTSRVARSGLWVLRGTAAAGGDSTPPAVAIVAPDDNATVSGTVTLRATATDNVGVSSVRFYAEDMLIGNATFTSGEWRLTADSTVVPDGVYLLRAVATDAAGNIGETEQTLTVQNDVLPPVQPVRVNTLDVSTIRLGSQPITRAYLGSVMVYGDTYIPPVTPPSGTPARVASYGPNGSHYPTRTPWVGSSTGWDYDVEVGCSWAAIASAITTATNSYPNGRVRIRVQPGTLPGNGAGSTSTPVLQNLGATGRQYRILVAPRDGAFSITHSASARIANVKGVSFVGFSPWSLGQAGTSASGIVLTECQDVAWAWSKGAAFNITSSSGNSSNIEYVECVAPESELNPSDRSAVRNGNGYLTSNVSYIGSYLAPMHKPAGSSAHCDTLQFSGNATSFQNIYFTDTAIFGSTNAALIMTGDGSSTSASNNVVFDHALIVGGTPATVVYPFPQGAYTSSGPTVGFNSKPTNCVAQNQTIISGKIVPTFKSVSSDSRATTSAPTPASGSWTVDSSIGATTGWFTANSPKPSDATLQSIWAW